MKGISPLIASVLLIAFTIAIAGVISGWMSGLTKTSTEAAGRGAKCSGAALSIVSSWCNAAANNVTAIVINSGSVDVGTLSMTVTDQSGNTTVGNNIYSGTISPGQSVALSLVLQPNNSVNDGDISKIRVTTTTCPGLYAEAVNRSTETKLGTC